MWVSYGGGFQAVENAYPSQVDGLDDSLLRVRQSDIGDCTVNTLDITTYFCLFRRHGQRGGGVGEERAGSFERATVACRTRRRLPT